MLRYPRPVVALVCSAALAGCGGGGSSGSGNPPPGGTVAIGSVTGPAYLQAGVNSPSTYVYSAAVTGSSDKTVLWSVDDSSLATISASGVVTPSAAQTGTLTITAAAHADPSQTSTLKVNVVDWILAGSDPRLIDDSGATAANLMPIASGYENCSWAYDHLKFICVDGMGLQQDAFYVFQTDGTQTGTTKTATIDLSGVSGLVWAGYPRYSPDGSQLLFQATAFSGFNVYIGPTVMDSAGKTQPRMIASEATLFDPTFSSPRFSPDGKQVLYAQSSGLWIVNADGSSPHNLAPAPATQGLLSPDGSTLYYASGGCLYKAPANGAGPVCIVNGVQYLMDISPSGAELVFLANSGISTTGGDIYIVDNDGSNLRQTYGLDWAAW